MNLSKRILLSCIVLGLMLAAVGYWGGASTSLYIDENRQVRVPRQSGPVYEAYPGDGLKNVQVDVGTADVLIQRGEGPQARVEIHYDWGEPPQLSWEDGVLSVKDKGVKHFITMGFFVSTQPNRVTITLPDGNYAIHAASDTGRVQVTGLSPSSLAVNSGTGGIRLGQIKCGSLRAHSGTGGIAFDEVVCAGLEAHSGTGGVMLGQVRCDSAQVESDTGGITLTDFACGGLRAHSGTGRVEVQGDLEGETDIESNTGSVTVRTTRPQAYYRIETSSGTGRITAPPGNAQADHSLRVITGTGGITVVCGENAG